MTHHNPFSFQAAIVKANSMWYVFAMHVEFVVVLIRLTLPLASNILKVGSVLFL